MSLPYITLPVITVQRDFVDVVRDVHEGVVPADKFWVSCYKTGERSVHASVEVKVKRDLIRFSAKEGDVEFVKTESGYTAGCRSLDIPPTSVALSAQDYTDPERTNPLRPQRITAFDVSPDASRFATGHLDGSVLIYPSTPPTTPYPNAPTIQQINTSKRKIVSKPHVSNITSLTFFPSSRVLLSSGTDFGLSILSAEFPETWPESSSGRVHPARVLRGHTRSVTSTGIIGQGRNIISSSLDWSLRLWDVTSGTEIHTLNASAPVLCTTIGTRIPTPPDGEDTPLQERDEGETPEVAHTITYAGLQTGSFEIFDWRTRSSTFKSSSSPTTSTAAINAISYLSSQSLLATGASDGIVTLYDIRSLASPLTLFQRNDAGITDLNFAAYEKEQGGDKLNVGLAIATADGLPYIASVIPEGPGVQTELIGVDCDPVRNIRVRVGSGVASSASEVWTASDDAVVRRYVV